MRLITSSVATAAFWCYAPRRKGARGMNVLKFIFWSFFGFVAVMLIVVTQPQWSAEMLSPARRIERACEEQYRYDMQARFDCIAEVATRMDAAKRDAAYRNAR